MKFGAPFSEYTCFKIIKRFSPHLNNVSTLPCETWLKCSSDTCHRWVVTERNSRIYPTSTLASIFARFESSWLQCVRTIARECVKTRVTDLDELKQRLRIEWAN